MFSVLAEREDIHPIIARRDEIERMGIAVFDDVRRVPLYDEPYTTPFMVVGLSLSGWVKVEYDMRPTVFRENDFAVLPPHHILCVRESSDDYRAMVIVVSAWFQEKIKRLYGDVYKDMMQRRARGQVQLDGEQRETVRNLFGVLADMSKAESPYRERMQEDLLRVVFLLYCDLSVQNEANSQAPSADEGLFSRFYKAIEEHHRESHEVKFYADLFRLSPKHFTTVIKEQTGINALAWINNYVAIQAKSMLRHMQGLSIQQVAEQLGFSEQATFSRFFKKQTGLSPSEYRGREE